MLHFDLPEYLYTTLCKKLNRGEVRVNIRIGGATERTEPGSLSSTNQGEGLEVNVSALKVPKEQVSPQNVIITPLLTICEEDERGRCFIIRVAYELRQIRMTSPCQKTNHKQYDGKTH